MESRGQRRQVTPPPTYLEATTSAYAAIRPSRDHRPAAENPVNIQATENDFLLPGGHADPKNADVPGNYGTSPAAADAAVSHTVEIRRCPAPDDDITGATTPCWLVLLLVVGCIVNPIFGVVSICLHQSPRKYRRAMIAVSLAGIIVSAAVLAATLSSIYACMHIVSDNSTFPYRVRTTSDRCVFGVYCAGSCYYDRRTESTNLPPLGPACDTSADLADDGFCYFSSSLVCDRARNHIKDICYVYRVSVASKATCVHGYYDGAQHCYYDTRYELGSGGSGCHDDSGDFVVGDTGRKYCYSSSPAACRNTMLYHNDICYKYAVESSTRLCWHGYYDDDFCFYDMRRSPSYSCEDGSADAATDGYCYYSSPFACRYARNYANGECYPYVYESTADRCTYGYYRKGYCYSWYPPSTGCMNSGSGLLVALLSCVALTASFA